MIDQGFKELSEANAWLSDLEQRLQVAGSGYRRCIGNDEDAEELTNLPGIRANRTSFAMLAVNIIMQKLQEAPGMREHSGLVPLHDLAASLWEIGRGGNPALLQPITGVGTGAEHISGRWVRQNALLCVAILEAAGMSGRAACRIVARSLADQGFTGRKRAAGPRPLSENTVVDWRNKSRQRDFARRDPSVAAFLDRNLTKFRSRPDWPFTETQALASVRDMLASPFIHSKSG